MNPQRSRSVKRGILVLFLLFIAIQAIPYGRDHTNPPMRNEPPWDSLRTRGLFFRVCKNCHSNETEWPWYSNIAPASWLVQHDVEHARRNLNVSEWGRTQKNKGDEAADEVRDNEMPPLYYRPLHPEAHLTPDERAAFIAGLERTFGRKTEGPAGSR
jgi:hypothetical protein